MKKSTRKAVKEITAEAIKVIIATIIPIMIYWVMTRFGIKQKLPKRNTKSSFPPPMFIGGGVKAYWDF